MTTLISADDHWTLWTILLTCAAVSIALEQKNKIAAKLTGPVLALVFGMILSNMRIVPTEAKTYDVIWEYVVILAIPLLLIRVNIPKIVRETGRMFGAFHVSSLGTIIGTFIAVFCLYKFIDEIGAIGGMMTGSYIGGGVNFFAMEGIFKPDERLTNATIVADSGVMALYFLVLLAMPASKIVRKIFPLTERSSDFYSAESADGAKAFWKPKPISLLDIATAMSLAFIIATVSVKFSGYFSQEDTNKFLKAILGQKYLVLTTVSIAVPFFLPKFTEKLSGTDELGTFLIYIFFVLIGIPASLKTVILDTPLLLLFCAIILFFNFLVTFGLGKLFKMELEELILVAAATSGGPMNAAGIAIAKGWKKLVLPSFLVGVWGYIIGNYIGYIVGSLLIKMLD